MFRSRISPAVAFVVCLGASSGAPFSIAQSNSGQPQILSTNQTITPLAPRGATYQALNPRVADAPDYTVGQAVTTVVSPDKKTLLILTSGFNLWAYPAGPKAGKMNPAASSEWVFVFDISDRTPVQKQALPVPNSYSGITFSPDGAEFYVSGGDDDNVHVFASTAGVWAEKAPAIALGHLAKANKAVGNSGGIGLQTKPEAAGLAVSADGKKIVVANYENDSINLLTKSGPGWSNSGELDLRPGVIDPKSAGVPGGEYPYWVQIKGNDIAYITSIRDHEVDVVSLKNAPRLVARIQLPGQPNRSLLDEKQDRLFVAQDNSDSVAVIDTASNKVMAEIEVTAPEKLYPNTQRYFGANPNSLTLSPDEKTLYVTDGGENAIAVVHLDEPLRQSAVAGLIPTGFYPNSVSTSADGSMLYVVNGKSATGPNPKDCHTITAEQKVACRAANQYTWQLTKAGFQTLPVPTDSELSSLTSKVLIDNNHMIERPLTAQQGATLAALRNNIHHVIYIIKENRTYDQVLGDLPVGNGDPSITQFPQKMTPNFHAIASKFVDFDDFYDASDVSGDGWPWSTSARTTDTIEKEIPPNYAGRGLNDDAEGTNRNINVGIAGTKEREDANPLGGNDPNVLPGTRDIAAPDGRSDDEQGQGYLWNAALKAGLTLRNYGFFVDLARYNLPAAQKKYEIPEEPDPFSKKLQVAYSSSAVLSRYSDKYFRGFDNSFPDYFRFTEWKREFTAYEKSGKLPSLEFVRLMHDHFGDYSTAIDGVNTPEIQIADNDYAVGLIAETIAHSRFKDDTLIFVIEDDAQDGGDHVDAHRSTAFVVGPYVKHGYVDSSRYNTVSMLRTIEDILKIEPLNLNDAYAQPMIDAFDAKQLEWDYTATPSAYLAKTTLPIPAASFAAASLGPAPSPLHNAAWWAEQCKGMDFSVEDHLDTVKFNHVLWTGTMGGKSYPDSRSGEDLRTNRPQLLQEYHAAQSPAPENAGGGR